MTWPLQLGEDSVTRLDAIPHQVIPLPLDIEPKPSCGWRRSKFVFCHISVKHGVLEYTSTDEAIDFLLDTGRDFILVKQDLVEAFCHIPVAGSNLWLLGICWDGEKASTRFIWIRVGQNNPLSGRLPFGT